MRCVIVGAALLGWCLIGSVIGIPHPVTTTIEQIPVTTLIPKLLENPDPPPLDLSGRSKACDVVIGIDETLWEKNDANLTGLVDLLQAHVDFANRVFTSQVMTEESGFEDVYFRLARVQVIFGSCDGFEDRNCTNHRDEYLEKFGNSYHFQDACLGYVFTYLDFHNGTAGLAYKGTACYPFPATNVKSQNVGFITLLNYGQDRPLEDSRITFAHELAHNFGAKHDNETNDPDCANKGYIMAESDVIEDDNGTLIQGPDENKEVFSPCSLKDMTSKLKEIESDRECYVYAPYEPDHQPVISICGNGVVDEGEQCDCGHHYNDCHDACCYPAIISPPDRYANASAVPCSRNEKRDCLHPVGLVYGVYVPLTVIFLSTILGGVLLSRDWRRNKRCFKHITHGHVRIVS